MENCGERNLWKAMEEKTKEFSGFKSPKAVVSSMKKMFGWLAALHAGNMIHGDLKPRNLMEGKIIDWGTALRVGDMARYNEFGTYGYIVAPLMNAMKSLLGSPKEPKELDARGFKLMQRVDVYAMSISIIVLACDMRYEKINANAHYMRPFLTKKDFTTAVGKFVTLEEEHKESDEQYQACERVHSFFKKSNILGRFVKDFNEPSVQHIPFAEAVVAALDKH